MKTPVTFFEKLEKLMNISCPHCHSKVVRKNGSIHSGKQKYECLFCQKQFLKDPQNKIIPWKQHSAVGKESGKTSYIERFNCTIRQRCSRLIRKALSFSKKIENHIGVIKMVICDYNKILKSLHV